MEFSDKQNKILQRLIKNRFNKQMMFFIMSTIRRWKEEDLDKLLMELCKKKVNREKIVDYWIEIDKKYPSEKNEKKEPVEEPIQKSILFLFPNPSTARMMSLELDEPNVEFKGFDFDDLNICMLPRNIHDDKELQRCLDESYIDDDRFWKAFQEFRSFDFSKYETIVVWNNMAPYSLLFLYMFCRFVDNCKIYENEVSKFDMSCYACGEEARDYSGIYNGLRKISPELKYNYANIYNRFVGKPVGPRVAEGYNIIELSDEQAKDRILSLCSDEEYINAFTLVCKAQGYYNSPNFISNSYIRTKLYDYILDEGLFDVIQFQDTKFATELYGESLMYEGVNLYFLGSYGVRLKKKWYRL